MSLLDFLKLKTNAAISKTDVSQNKEQTVASERTQDRLQSIDQSKNDAIHEIPENVFIEYANPKSRENMDPIEVKSEVTDLQMLYRHLEQNLEKKGYEDALVNPDSSYMEEHVLYISNELNLLIAKIKTYYTGYIRTIDFHIETRKRNGMIETVDELLTHKETILEEIKIVSAIEDDANKGTGISQNLILGYKKGFRNGFAAITYNHVLGKRN